MAARSCSTRRWCSARTGREIARYRKIHLFDITAPRRHGVSRKRAVRRRFGPRLLRGGGHALGCTICYDMRFPELFQELRRRGAEAILVPSNFTLQTGKDHWEALLRARAIDTQCWILAAASYGSYEERGARAASMAIRWWWTPGAMSSRSAATAPAGLGDGADRPGRDRAGARRHAARPASRRRAAEAANATPWVAKAAT
jgi:deaminated glutathione amidase